jgi:hypothetical protein
LKIKDTMKTSTIGRCFRAGAARRLAAGILLSLVAAAQAQTAPTPSTVAPPNPAAMPGHAGAQPLVSPPLPAVPGALSWDLLAQVKPVKLKGKLVPEFSAAVLKLDRQEVKVAGFMLPLQSSERQSHFLLTVTSQTCSFCVPAGPEGIIEVRTRTPVRVTFDPVLIAGRLEVLRDDPTGVYYRISNGEALPIR